MMYQPSETERASLLESVIAPKQQRILTDVELRANDFIQEQTVLKDEGEISCDALRDMTSFLCHIIDTKPADTSRDEPTLVKTLFVDAKKDDADFDVMAQDFLFGSKLLNSTRRPDGHEKGSHSSFNVLCDNNDLRYVCVTRHVSKDDDGTAVQYVVHKQTIGNTEISNGEHEFTPEQLRQADAILKERIAAKELAADFILGATSWGVTTTLNRLKRTVGTLILK